MRRGQPIGFGLGLTGIVALFVVLSPVSNAASPAFSKALRAPYSGTAALTNLSTFAGSAYSCVCGGNFVDLSLGASGFNASASANTSMLQKGAPYDRSYSGSDADASIVLEVPFRNMSGTRILDSVNVTINFTVSGAVTFFPGVCPFVKAVHAKNECLQSVTSAAYLWPGTMTYLKGNGSPAKGPTTQGTCYSSTIGCVQNTVGKRTGAINDSTNSSKAGLMSNQSGTTGASSFSISATVSFLYTPTSPLTKSRTLAIEVETGGIIGANFYALHGRGGISGGRATASIDLSMKVISVVES